MTKITPCEISFHGLCQPSYTFCFQCLLKSGNLFALMSFTLLLTGLKKISVLAQWSFDALHLPQWVVLQQNQFFITNNYLSSLRLSFDWDDRGYPGLNQFFLFSILLVNSFSSPVTFSLVDSLKMKCWRLF